MPVKFMTRMELERYLAEFLCVDQFHDYCPNGLQVEGRERISRIVTGVTACQALLEQAVKHDADAVLVHHGYFWKSENPAITHTKKQRLKLLLSYDINLFAYHLPLDAHAIVGNNVQLARQLDLSFTENFGDQGLLSRGELQNTLTLREFGGKIETSLGRKPLIIGAADRPVRRVAWCTGGAQGYFHTIATQDIDAYVTGEASEFVTHLARESGVAFIAAGHHATERYGIRALGEHLHARFGLEHIHLDIDNPI